MTVMLYRILYHHLYRQWQGLILASFQFFGNFHMYGMRRTYLLKLTIVLHEMNLFMYWHRLIIQMCDYISIDFREFQSKTFCLYRILLNQVCQRVDAVEYEMRIHLQTQEIIGKHYVFLLFSDEDGAII